MGVRGMARAGGARGENGGARICVVECQPTLLVGLASVIDAEPDLCVSGRFSDTGEAIEAVARDGPDAVVVGLCYHDTTGTELIRRIRRVDEKVPILSVTPYDEAVFAVRALHAGANGYVMTSAPTATIPEAIRAVLAGDVFVSDNVASALIRQHLNGNRRSPDQSPLHDLSDREMEIFEMIGRGRSVRDIARILCRSAKTVEAHREHIKLKLHIESSEELARYASAWAMSRAPQLKRD